MNFVGTGKRLAQGDIGSAARTIGVDTAVLLAFLEVEAAGRGFDGKNRPKMLRETHIFYRELGAGTLRTMAVKVGLANKNWVRNYKSDSYPDLERMMRIDENAALRSCSWALGQILGNNCVAAGFPNARQFVEAMKQGEREQLLALVTLMQTWGMVKLLTGRDFTKPDSWRDAASRYNGPGYAANGYHTKMAAAYVKHAGKTDEMVVIPLPAVNILQFGLKGEAVRNLQNDLAALGYKFELGIDGRFGNETKSIVEQFQRKHGLRIDGKVGRETQTAIDGALAKLDDIVQPASPEWKEQQPQSWLASMIAAFMELLK